MPMKNETSALLADLTSRLEQVVEAARAEGHAEALEQLRSLVGGGSPIKRGPGRPLGSKNAPKAAAVPATASTPKKKRKSSWAGLTPEARLARVNAIRKGKGLPPKSA